MDKLPAHLKKILKVTERDDTSMSGQIVCECGCGKFGIKYFGDKLNENGDEYPYICAAEYKEKTALTVKCVCKNCGSEGELFDFAKHAYDGLICETGISVPDTELVDLDEDGGFEIGMTIEYDSEEQFTEEILNDPPEGMSFSPDDRYSIWSWAVIELKGLNKIIKLVDEELA